MNSGLFPATTLVRSVLAMRTGQLIPKQISIVASNTLMGDLRFLPLVQFLVNRYRPARHSAKREGGSPLSSTAGMVVVKELRNTIAATIAVDEPDSRVDIRGVKFEQHAVVSLGISAVLYAFTRSWGLAVSSFLMGTLVDLDHVLDFWREFGIRADIRRIFEVCHGRKLKYAVVFLHGWEWIVVGSLLTWWSGWHPWVAGSTLGLGHHLILDQFTNRAKPLGYSVIWRSCRGFRLKEWFHL